MEKIIHIILLYLSKISGKKFLYTKNKANKTAVWSDFRFWYRGDVFDSADIAYGVVQNGFVESYSSYLLYNLITQIKSKQEKVIFYDIGSNTGFFGILALATNNHVETYFFDPIAEFLGCVEESVYLNRFEERSTINNIGLSDAPGSLTFHLQGSGTTVDPAFINNNDSEQREITVLPLDTYTQAHPMPDIIKIDVEGLEYKVLLGAKQTLTHHPILYIEIAQTLKIIGREYNNQNFTNIFGLLEKSGYTSYLVNDTSIATIADYHTLTIDGIHMYLFLHTVKHSSIIASISDLYIVDKIHPGM